MLTIIIRATIIYILVLVVFRVMGKRQLGQMQPFELVLTLIIADLATIPMAEMSVPFLNGVVPLFTLVILHFFLTTISKKSSKLNNIISGKPVIIINPKGIDIKALNKLNITIDDLLEGVRNAGYFSFEQIQYAIMETNGKISVMPKPEFAPSTNQDLKIKVEDTSLPVTIISEGKINTDNLSLLKISKSFIEKTIKKYKIDSIKKVLILTLDYNGKLYLEEYNKQFITAKIKLEN